MKDETFPQSSREMLESRIGEKGIQNLREVAKELALRKKLFLHIKDTTLIDTAIDELEQIIKQEEQRVGIEKPLNFIKVDFRKKGSKAWFEELTQLLGKHQDLHYALIDADKNPSYRLTPEHKAAIENARNHIESSRLILIDPAADEDKYYELNRISLYAQNGVGTLAVVRKGLQPSGVISTLGGDLDWSKYLDYDPLETNGDNKVS